MLPGLTIAQIPDTTNPSPVSSTPSLELQPYASMDEIAITSHGARMKCASTQVPAIDNVE